MRKHHYLITDAPKRYGRIKCAIAAIRYLLLIAFLSNSPSAGGQPTCNSNNLTSNPDRYKLQQNFIPYASQPVKTIRINFHVIQNSNLPNMGNFQNTPADMAFINLIVTKLNEKFANLEPPHFPQTCVCSTACFIPDTRMRVQLMGVSFHNDPNLFLTTNISACLNAYGTNMDKELNIFFVGDNGGSVGGAAIPPSYTQMNTKQGIRFANYNAAYENALSSGTPTLDWLATDLTNNMFHEIGHTMGLLHLYSQTGFVDYSIGHFDYLDDFWGANTSGCPQISTPVPEWCCPSGGPTNSCSQNWMGGYCAATRREATPKQLGRVHRSTMLSSFRKYVKPSTNLQANHLITANETWNFDIRMYSHIVVKNGAKLTIRCKVLMPPDGKIIVEKGGVLDVDGGIITTVDNTYLWQGIEVWGDQTKSQFAYNGTMYQGKLITKNNALIENAREAVRLWNPADWTSMGGIVQASNTTFKNNRRNVEFIAYENHIPNQPQNVMDNISYFTRCKFLHTAALNSGQPPQYMVTLWGVRGVKFNGCDFSYDYEPSFSYRPGIYSIDASYRVGSNCNSVTIPCPTANLKKSKFNNLSNAITITGSMAYYPVFVRESEFYDCNLGIITDEVNDCSFTDNFFTTQNDHCSGAIYLQGATGYIVEGNTITSGPSEYDFGIMVVNSGGDYNELYKNDFNDLPSAIISQQTNFIFSTETIWDGLKFICNDMSGSTAYDIYIAGGAGSAYHQAGGQNGSQIIAAGNKFTATTGTLPWNYRNLCDPTLNINYYHGSNSIEIPTNIENVFLFSASNNSCPNKKSGSQDKKLTSQELTSAKSGFNAAQQAYTGAVDDYNSTIDGGNTQGLITAIQNSTPAKAAQLHNTLVSNSPLSHQVIMATIASEILDNSLLYDLLTYNADAVRNSQTVQALKDQAIPMPGNMIDDLIDLSASRTLKDELELKVAYQNGKRKEYLSSIIGHYLYVTDSIDFDSLDVWVSKLGNEYYGLLNYIDFLLSKNDVTTAMAKMNLWKNMGGGIPEFEEQITKTADFFTGYTANFFNAGKKVWPSSQGYFDDLVSIVAEDNLYTSAKAKNIIRFDELGEYEILPLPQLRENHDETEKNTDQPQINNLVDEPVITAYPNPFSRELSIYLSPELHDKRLEVTMINITGQVVYSHTGSQHSVNESLSRLQTLPDGLYIMRVKIPSVGIDKSIKVRKIDK